MNKANKPLCIVYLKEFFLSIFDFQDQKKIIFLIPSVANVVVELHNIGFCLFFGFWLFFLKKKKGQRWRIN